MEPTTTGILKRMVGTSMGTKNSTLIT